MKLTIPVRPDFIWFSIWIIHDIRTLRFTIFDIHFNLQRTIFKKLLVLTGIKFGLRVISKKDTITFDDVVVLSRRGRDEHAQQDGYNHGFHTLNIKLYITIALQK